MTEVQKILTKIYKQFAEEMSKSDIEWVLYAGNQLGAVREGGWIPWDDDVDVAIAAKDRQKFLDFFKDNEVFQYEKPLSPHRSASFIKVYSKEYSYVRMRNGKEVREPLWIDVFSLFRQTKPKRSRWDVFWTHFLFARNNIDDGRLINIAKLPLKIVPGFIFRWALRRKYKKSKGEYIFEDARYSGTLYGADVSDRVFVDWNGIKSPIFKKNKEYLASRYGKTWNERPEESKRKQHDVFKIDNINAFEKTK